MREDVLVVVVMIAASARCSRKGPAAAARWPAAAGRAGTRAAADARAAASASMRREARRSCADKSWRRTTVRRSGARRCAVTSPDAREGRVATTDQQGRFEIKELPAGRYTMTASKGGFVSLQYGQRRPSESGTPIELGDGQTMEKIAIALPRGSVLGGRITDEFGEPVANASVSAWRYALRGRRAAHDAGGPERARHHRRSGTLPVVRPAARRLLRQRHAPQRRTRGHRSDGRAVGLCGDVFSRHAERRRSHAHHARRLAGKHRHQLRLDRDAPGSRRGAGVDVRRSAGDQRHGRARAGERERTSGHRDAAGRRRQSHRSNRRVPRHQRRARPLSSAGARRRTRVRARAARSVGRHGRCRWAHARHRAGRDRSTARS